MKIEIVTQVIFTLHRNYQWIRFVYTKVIKIIPMSVSWTTQYMWMESTAL